MGLWCHIVDGDGGGQVPAIHALRELLIRSALKYLEFLMFQDLYYWMSLY